MTLMVSTIYLSCFIVLVILPSISLCQVHLNATESPIAKPLAQNTSLFVAKAAKGVKYGSSIPVVLQLNRGSLP